MADNTSSLATALLGLQRRRTDPFESQREFARGILKQGTQTTPVLSPLEGIARALQGGVGGFFEGQADREQKAQGQNNVKVLADALSAKDQQSMTEGLKGYQGDTDVIAPILAQMLAVKQGQFRNGAAADNFAGAYAPPGGAATASPAATAPLPTGAVPSGAFANNLGNIRATNINWQDKGAPQNGFETFGSPQSGANAQFQNFQAYAQQNPNLTVAQALAKWAPPNENNTQAYVQRIAEESGINPGLPLAEVLKDPMVAARLTDAQARLEKGGLPPGVTADTFVKAAGGQSAPSAPLTINMPGPKLPQQGDQPAADGSGTPIPPSATSGPPDVARPQPSAEQITKYKKLIADGVLSGPQAVQELDKEITGQWGLAKQQALEVWKDQQASKRQNEKAAIDLGQKAPMELITKRVDNYENKLRPAAVSAANDINAIHSVRQILDAGAFTGTGAEAKTMLGKLGEQFGIPSDQAVNTQVLGAVLAKRVLAAAGGTLGTGFSNADRDFVERASGGQISMDEAAMRKLADIGERDARLRIAQHDQEVGRLKKLPGIGQLGDDQFTIPTAPTYAEFNKANPLAGQTAAPTAAPSGQIPTVASPEEAGKLPKGTQFRDPNGVVRVVP